jgi:magnesium transporter
VIIALAPAAGRLAEIDTADLAALAHAVWIDLVDPTDAEKVAVERATGLHVASVAELQEIESSSRLNAEDGVLSLSMPFVQFPTRGGAKTRPLGFVLDRDRLITERFAPSVSFDTVHQRVPRLEDGHRTGAHVLVTLLEVIVDRLADQLEKIRDELDDISRHIFQEDLGSGRAPRREDRALRRLLRGVGGAGESVSHIRDSLLAVGRIVPFVGQNADWLAIELQPRLATLRQDIASLSDYDLHLANKVQFLLDATLGFINIAQNNIIKVLTVVSVVGIPPTLVASVYGMNFKDMPELGWSWGYPYGLLVILASAILPLVVFRLRGWL